MIKFTDKIVSLFPVWIFLGSVIALIKPEIFVWFKPYIEYALMVIMLGMGLTLQPKDFKDIIKNPLYVGIAATIQFTVMPLLGWSIGLLFSLEKPLAVGLIIVSCCPGGTASNVICYLARVNVALSVAMTAFCTIIAVIMTPFLTTFIIGNTIDISGLNLFVGTAKVVLVPIILGVLINRYLPILSKKVVPFSPFFALIAILLVIGSIIGEDQQLLFKSGFKLLFAVTTLHILGFGLGYIFARLILKNETVSRTIGIEVGMQNSGLGAVLAKDNFPNLIGVAAPSAITGSVHNIIGSLLVWIFRKWPSNNP